MYELNSLSVKYRLRDLERQFTPQLKEFRAEGSAPKFHAAATLLACVVVALTLGAAYLV